MTEEKLEKVSTDQLRPRDLLVHHGMRVRLGERNQYAGNSGEPAWWFPGTVQNMDEVFHRDHITAGLLHADGQWTIQGNDLADWWRVVDANESPVTPA